MHHILTDVLGMNKLCERWVLCNLNCLKRNKTNFACQFVTVDETWIHPDTHKIMVQSKHGQKLVILCNKKQTIPFAGKVACFLVCGRSTC